MSNEIGASCVTGAVVIALTNPLDCLKQRWQVEPTSSVHRSITSFARDIVRTEGIMGGLWTPGLASNMCACTISVGTRIGMYPMLREQLSMGPSLSQKSGASMFLSGLAGGALGYILSAPFFAASRIAHAEAGMLSPDGLLITGARRGLPPTALGSSNGLPMLAHMAMERGVLGLWRGSEVLVARGALMSATQLATYDGTKATLRSYGLPDGPAMHCFASLIASLALTTAICPLDVTYTAFLAGPSLGRPHSSPWATALSLAREGGPTAFLRGWTPLWLRFLPSSVLTFVIYEQSRRVLLGKYLD